MKKRKLELALVLLAVAVAMFLFRESTLTERPSTPEKTPAQTVTMPKLEMSEDAKWIVTTAADSYSPRIKVEKFWADSRQGKAGTAPRGEPGVSQGKRNSR